MLDLIKARSALFRPFEAMTVLSFDEMNIDSRVSYDSSDDVILGPHKNVQVAMIISGSSRYIMILM